MKEKTLKIYKITNKSNNKIYIGQTSETLEQRFNRHMGYQSIEHDTKFYRAVRKYGKENFKIELLDTASKQEELDEKEMYWINKLDSINNGYNSSRAKGKRGGDTLSNHPNLLEIKQKLSKSKIGDLNPHSVKVIAINIITNEEFVFNTMKECKDALGFSNHDCISKRCLNKISKPYKGIWQFKYLK